MGRRRQAGTLAGDAIPIYSRIALLAQVIDVFQTATAARPRCARSRTRRPWFDPAIGRRPSSGRTAAHSGKRWRPTIRARRACARARAVAAMPVDEDYLDDIAAAFGQVVDSKSPFTAGHSARVGAVHRSIAAAIRLPEPRRRWRLGAARCCTMSASWASAIPFSTNPASSIREEWEAVKMHATYTETILSRIYAVQRTGRARRRAPRTAGRHRLSTRPEGRRHRIETRIITTADIFGRPLRRAPVSPGHVDWKETLKIMQGSVGPAIDPACYDALCRVARETEG